MDFIQSTTESWPKLENTLLVAAFSGWNDAAGSASTAVRLLSEKSGSQSFATIDPEEFYVFTENRPMVSLDTDGLRKLSWPDNQFAAVENIAGLNRSLVTLIGIEPDLKWRTFGDVFMEICQRCNVTEVMILGAMVATVPHSRPVPITGWSTNPERRGILEGFGAQPSRYQGPTGIVGVLATRLQESNIPYSSLWAIAPTYLSVSPNWKVAARLLGGIDQLFGLSLDMSEAQTNALKFEAQVAEAVGRQPDIATFVHALEENYDRGDSGESDEVDESPGWRERDHDDDGELPSADFLIQELEKRLRQQREGNGEI